MRPSPETIAQAIAMRKERDGRNGYTAPHQGGRDIRWIGELAELAADGWFRRLATLNAIDAAPDWIRDNERGRPDFVAPRVGIDVKCRRASLVLEHYTVGASDYHHGNPYALLWFVMLAPHDFDASSGLRMVCVGGLDADEFRRVATRASSGDRVHDNYAIRDGSTSQWLVRIADLWPPMEWIGRVGLSSKVPR